MQIKLLVIGKTDKEYLKKGVDIYIKRIERYVKFNYIICKELKNSKNLSVKEYKIKEGEILANNFSDSDYLVLLDEKGVTYSSVEFAKFLENKQLSSIKQIVFVIGGPYGFSDAIYKRANKKISLSKMTFSHQMVRLIFCEQLYRAFTIINNEPYNHI